MATKRDLARKARSAFIDASALSKDGKNIYALELWEAAVEAILDELLKQARSQIEERSDEVEAET
jgi:hypothetical protein